MRIVKVLPLFAVLCIVFTQCTTYLITSEVSSKVTDLHIWCDYLPGSIPKTVAVFRCTLKNTTSDTLRFTRPTGTIIDARSTSEIRRFTCQILVDETPVKVLTLTPNKQESVIFKSPNQVVPFDVKLYDKVQMVVKTEGNNEKMLQLSSGIVTPTKTE